MKIKRILLMIAATVGFSCFLPNNTILAKKGETCGDVVLSDNEYCCDGIVTTSDICGSGTGDGISLLLLKAINILTALVSIAAVGGLVFGSILYTTAAGDSAKTKKGITVITNVVIGLIAFASMWALLNFMIPGGVFK